MEQDISQEDVVIWDNITDDWSLMKCIVILHASVWTRKGLCASLISVIAMPHYIILFSWRDQGVRNVKDTIKRLENYKTAVEGVGGKPITEYYTLGKYDIVSIVEAPNDEAIMSVLLSTGKLGNVRSETLKAFPLSEAAKIIEKLS